MKSIIFFAKLFKFDGKASVGTSVMLQIFELSTNRWKNIRTAKTNNKGIIGSSIGIRLDVKNPPMMRMILGTSGSNVLATGGVMTFDKTREVLNVDFGEIEILAGEAFPLKASNAKFARLKMQVSGQERKAVAVNTVAMTRMFVPMGGAAVGAAAAAARPTAEMTTLRASEATLRNQLTAKDAQFNTQRLELINTKTSRDRLNDDLKREKTKSRELQSALERNSGSKEAEINELRTSRENEKRRATTAESENVELKRRLRERPDAAVRSAPLEHKPIANVVTSFGSEMHNANTKLKRDKMPFKVSGVKVRVKGVLNDQGAIALNDPDKTASAGSEIEFSIDGQTEDDAQHLVVVPDITNLTESLARRMLAVVGLRLEHSTQTFAKDANVAHGECVNQSPTAGVSSPIGSNVFAVFAVKKEE